MRVIAIEEHFITPMYREKVAANEFRNFYLASRSEQLGHDIVEQNLDLGQKRLAHMDAAGVDVQVLSFGSPGPQAFGADVAIPMARQANDLLFETIKTYPERFAGFAALPTASPDAAVDELERCVRKLGFRGAMIHGHQQGSFLDDRKYWPIFERAQALDVPIYLHPTLPHPLAVKAYFEGYEELARAGWGFAVDTSCHFLRLVLAGVFDAYPRLKIILGHLGEGLPFAMHRLDDHTHHAAARRRLKKRTRPGWSSSGKSRSAISTARRSRTSTPSGCCDSERKRARPSDSLLENQAEHEKRRRPKCDEDSPAFRVRFLQRRLQRGVGDLAEDMPSDLELRPEKPHQPRQRDRKQSDPQADFR